MIASSSLPPSLWELSHSLFFHVFFCLFCCIFILSLLFFCSLFCSLPQWGCQLHANLMALYSADQAWGCVFVSAFSYAMCQDEADWDGNSVIKGVKPLLSPPRCVQRGLCADDLSMHMRDQYIHLSSLTKCSRRCCVCFPVVIQSCVSG